MRFEGRYKSNLYHVAVSYNSMNQAAVFSKINILRISKVPTLIRISRAPFARNTCNLRENRRRTRMDLALCQERRERPALETTETFLMVLHIQDAIKRAIL